VLIHVKYTLTNTLCKKKKDASQTARRKRERQTEMTRHRMPWPQPSMGLELDGPGLAWPGRAGIPPTLSAPQPMFVRWRRHDENRRIGKSAPSPGAAAACFCDDDAPSRGVVDIGPSVGALALPPLWAWVVFASNRGRVRLVGDVALFPFQGKSPRANHPLVPQLAS